MLDARARVEVAQERVDTILDQIRMLHTGVLSPQVAAAQNVVDQAQAAKDQAEAAVRGAAANLGLIGRPKSPRRSSPRPQAALS